MLLAATNFLIPNLTFVFELLAFLVVLYVLSKYVLPVLNKNVEERQATIRQGLADAEEARAKVQQAQAEFRRTMDEARAEARAMVEEASRAGEQLRVQARERGQREAGALVERAQADLDAAVRRAQEELRAEVAGLVITSLERIVGEGFTTADHRELVERTVREVEAEAAPASQVRA